MLQIKKRNGIIVPFDKQRIISAINKAFIEVDGQLYEEDTAKEIADEVYYWAKQQERIISVEDVQDQVEDFLMQSDRRDVAKSYIRYRFKHEAVRNSNNDFIKALSEKINAKDIENQNANVDEQSFGGRIGAASDLQLKKYALDFCVSDLARRNHENNEIYIHDLSAYAVGEHNCLSIPFDDLLAKGFNTRQTDVRPAGSVNTAMQLVAVIFQLQSLCQFGGVSATHLDWTMVPYVRKSFWKHAKDAMKYMYVPPHEYSGGTGWRTHIDEMNQLVETLKTNNANIEEIEKIDSKFVRQYAMDMTQREVHQAVEGMYHNLK